MILDHRAIGGVDNFQPQIVPASTAFAKKSSADDHGSGLWGGLLRVDEVPDHVADR